MLVFGGTNIAQQVSSILYILHLNNLTWTEGPDVGSANARGSHVCATYGDSFIVWGGKKRAQFWQILTVPCKISANTLFSLLGYTTQNGLRVVVNNTPLIYNIPNNTWVQNFVVSNTPPTKATSTSTGPASAPSDNVAPPPSPKKIIQLRGCRWRCCWRHCRRYRDRIFLLQMAQESRK